MFIGDRREREVSDEHQRKDTTENGTGTCQENVKKMWWKSLLRVLFDFRVINKLIAYFGRAGRVLLSLVCFSSSPHAASKNRQSLLIEKSRKEWTDSLPSNGVWSCHRAGRLGKEEIKRGLSGRGPFPGRMGALSLESEQGEGWGESSATQRAAPVPPRSACCSDLTRRLKV